MPGQSENPRMYMSYSWSSPEHEEWVRRLATELVESGVDVILDKWHLREGQDAHAFMERMVSDKTIKKVALVCDSVYAEKADNRTGGVGTETQIITPDIYSQQDQTKFVAVIAERDEHGKPYVPTYYKSRIYIDLSDPTTYAENFDRLIRWAYDQPLHKRPDLGPKPAFLTADADALHLGTSARHRRAIDALKAGRDYALPAVTEYLDLMAAELEKLRLKSPATREEVETFDETVLTSIGAFLPYRNELIEFFATAALYQDTEPMRAAIQKFFERLIPYLDRPANLNSWREYDFDNYKFIIQELFLYLIATFIKADRLEGAAYFLDQEYYVAGNSVHALSAPPKLAAIPKPTIAVSSSIARQYVEV